MAKSSQKAKKPVIFLFEASVPQEFSEKLQISDRN